MIETEVKKQNDDTWVVWGDYTKEEALRFLHEGDVDTVYWGVTNVEEYERRLRNVNGRVLCVYTPFEEN